MVVRSIFIQSLFLCFSLLISKNRNDNNNNLLLLKMTGASLVAQMVKRLSAMWETWVQSLGWEDPLENLQYSCLENPMDRGAWWAI